MWLLGDPLYLLSEEPLLRAMPLSYTAPHTLVLRNLIGLIEEVST